MNKDELTSKPENGASPDIPKKGISRRGFLRGAGLTTVGTVALQTGVLGQNMPEETLEEKALGPSCTVWVDGKPVNSCLTLAVEVQGQEITTIEGIGSPEKLHPVQEAFIEHDATQCGFCTPGMIMTAVNFLQNHPKPNLEEVKVALRGNLCRCGTQPNVFKATLAASKKM